MQNILFRADSSSKIGTGHIMRDLVLADQFPGATIIFATLDLPMNLNDKIKEKQHTIEILQSNDIEELMRVITKHSIHMIIIDHYDIDYYYEKRLKEETGVKIFVLDDTYEKHYCDILLNHNINADATRYAEIIPTDCELRCGPKYTLLRKEFIHEKLHNPRITNNRRVKNIFLAMGGADHSNINIQILKVLENFTKLDIHVVTTLANQYLDDLKQYVQNKHNITLHINTNTIAKLMSQADFAIVTPSVTLNEIFYMNLPFIAIKTAENQREIYNFLVAHGYIGLEVFDALVLKMALEDILNG